MPGISNALSGASAAARPASTPVLRAMLSRMVLNDVRNGVGPARCRLTHARGTHERMAYADAMSVSRSVMEAGKASLSRDEQVSIGKGIDLLGTRSAEQLGPVLVEYLTTFGAVRGAIVELLREGADAERLAPLLDKFDKNLVTIGIRMGECKGIPDAARNKYTGKVCDAVEAGKKLMVKCAGEVGSEELLRGVAQSILPNSILQSLTERQPHLVEAFQEPDGAKKLLDVIVSTAAHKLEAGLISHIGTGGAESFSGAVLDILKTAEYIVPGQKGQAGESPADPVDVNAPVRPDELRNLAGPGAPVLYNNVHSPVKVVNELGDLVKFMERDRSLPLNEVRNLVKDAHRIGQRLGATQERLRSQSDLIAKLLEDNARLRNIVSRTEFESRGTDARNDLDGHTLRERHATLSTQSIDLGSLDSLGTPSPRRVDVAERKQQGSNDSTQKIIRQDDRTENVLERGSGNGNDGTRRTPRGSEDQTDGRSSPPKQPSDPKRPDGGDQLDLTRSDRNLQQKGDDDMQRIKSDTDTNTSIRIKLDRTNRFNVSGAPGTTDDVDREWLNYLAALDIAPAGTPEDPYQPVGQRSLFNSSEAAATRPNRTLSAVDLKQYLAARKLKVAQGEAGRNDRPGNVDFRPKPVSDAVPRSAELDRLARLLSGQQWLGRDELRIEPLALGVTSTPLRSPLSSPVSDAVRQAAVLDSLNKLSDAEHPESDRDDEGIEVSETRMIAPQTPPRMSPPEHARDVVSNAQQVLAGRQKELSSPPIVSVTGKNLERGAPAGIPSQLAALARSISWPPGSSATTTTLRSRSDSLASVSSTGSRPDPLRDRIVADSRSPRGTVERHVRFDDKVEYFSDSDSGAGESADSGNESPLGPSSADWEPQRVDRVADRAPVELKARTAKAQMGEVIAELKQLSPRQLRTAL
ncbi:hypothetical protein PDM28_13615 [Stenotrophomonas aracearum]|jgi:hypothetical protein|uniref:Avirulence protein n=1 Tax=Stenotrophomonas aracearum TaxID=3003272 RepID=A0ABY9YA13_9GAMM|nr:hypothetical protein [Stenotrophomonas sp. A5588]WNH47712.1 hypothetical protein PDM28_13615 [Stenotrophomonas sp. A5588]